MAPRNKFTREEIVSCAVELVRECGMEALTARGLALRLGTSAKPIFGLFSGMEDLKDAVIARADEIYSARIAEAMRDAKELPYKASGLGYIRFASEEKELFKLLFMRDRTGEKIVEDREAVMPMLKIIMATNGFSEDEAYSLHLTVWIFVHGVATMAATGYLKWDEEQISKMLTDTYRGLILRYSEGQK